VEEEPPLRNIRIFYEGADIYPDVSLSMCVHDMYAEKRSDSLIIKFNDTRGLWGSWAPKTGGEISVESGPAATGQMFVDCIVQNSGSVTLKALSAPISARAVNSKKWEKVRLLQIGNEIAGRHKLKFAHYGVADHLYGCAEQDSEPDFAFLQRLCLLEGAAFLVFDGKLVLYDEQFIEAQAAGELIETGGEGGFIYNDNSGYAYGAAEVSGGPYTGFFSAPEGGGGGDTLKKAVRFNISSQAEANRFARGLLRDANKNAASGAIWRHFAPQISAGSMVNLKTGGKGAWGGPVFVTHMRHDYLREQSKIFFRKPLHGY